ncbi:MAG TPA: hypothetical protein DCQ43_03705 [Treponema sp.]|nr:hypothetical protein [Treponema sp.]
MEEYMKTVKKIFVALTLFCAMGSAWAMGSKDASTAKSANRIVSLAPANSEILCAVGAYDQIVARTDFCDFPAELSKKPSVGGFDGKTVSVETILAYQPDFVYGTSGMHDFLKQPLEAAGITLYLSKADSVEAVIAEIRTIGKITGHAAQAESLASSMQKELSAIKKAVAKEAKPTVYYEVWGNPYMTVGNKSFINGIIQAAGGTNIFASVDGDYPMISEESVIAQNPQFIIIPNMNGETKKSISSRRGWADIQAVKDGNVYFIDSDVYSRPGPRVIEAIKNIAQILHPGVTF